MKQPIPITATAKQIEAIYFKDGAFDVFESPATRRARRGFLWVIPIAGAFILYTLDKPNSGTLIGLAATAIIGQSILLALAFNNLNKQRQHIVDFARSVEKAGTAELRTSPVGFSLTHKGAEHLERWVNVHSATIAEDHIQILTPTSYLFPKAAMPEEEFISLCELVREHTLLKEQEHGDGEIEKRQIGFQRAEGTTPE